MKTSLYLKLTVNEFETQKADLITKAAYWSQNTKYYLIIYKNK